MYNENVFHKLLEQGGRDRKAELWAKITARSAVERNEENVTRSAFRPSIRVLTAVATCCLAVIITLAVVLPGLITPGESVQPSLSELGYKPYDPTIPTVDMSTVEIRNSEKTLYEMNLPVLSFNHPQTSVTQQYENRDGEIWGYQESSIHPKHKLTVILKIVSHEFPENLNAFMLKSRFIDGVNCIATQIDGTVCFYLKEKIYHEQADGKKLVGYNVYAYFDYQGNRYFVQVPTGVSDSDLIVEILTELLGIEQGR